DRLTLEEAADQVRRKAQEQGLRIRTDFPEQLLHTHDADWLGEAVFNLLDNAVKYSLPAADKAAGENCQEAGSRTGERNEILLGAGQNEMFVRIWVSDHGTGIEEGDEAKVFQRFYRGSNAKKTEGFGLGLYLAREIVLLHNGFVKLKRQKDGTCVEIYLERSSTASR
ncbi:MAG: sensor histidine kinase, partial [Schaedlerella sp.]|uniref:sensor histidine kinase n=1 Tax=Schaedlerella sp. TaxID=2676057 RepID=UPI0035274436